MLAALYENKIFRLTDDMRHICSIQERNSIFKHIYDGIIIDGNLNIVGSCHVSSDTPFSSGKELKIDCDSSLYVYRDIVWCELEEQYIVEYNIQTQTLNITTNTNYWNDTLRIPLRCGDAVDQGAKFTKPDLTVNNKVMFINYTYMLGVERDVLNMLNIFMNPSVIHINDNNIDMNIPSNKVRALLYKFCKDTNSCVWPLSYFKGFLNAFNLDISIVEHYNNKDEQILNQLLANSKLNNMVKCYA